MTDDRQEKDASARKARAEALRREIREIETGTRSGRGRPPSPREITDEAARAEAERLKR